MDWKAIKKFYEGYGNLTKLAQDVNELAIRGSGLAAFKKGHFKFLDATHSWNKNGQLTGLIASAKARRFFNRFSSIGRFLGKIPGIPFYDQIAAGWKLDWLSDTSARGIGANTAVMLSRAGVESAFLAPVEGVGLVSQGIGWSAGQLGFKETEEAIRIFSIQLEGTTENLRNTVNKHLSPEVARDLLTWDRTFVNPANLKIAWREAVIAAEDIGNDAAALYDGIVDAASEYFSR